MKSWYCKSNCNLAKQVLLLTIFAQRSIVDVWQGSEFASGPEYPKALNIRLFWICQDSAYVYGSEYASVLNTAKSWKLLCDCWIFFFLVFSSLRSLFFAVQLFYINSSDSRPAVSSPLLCSMLETLEIRRKSRGSEIVSRTHSW